MPLVSCRPDLPGYLMLGAKTPISSLADLPDAAGLSVPTVIERLRTAFKQTGA
ncbi:hypothetical protein JTY93_10550 [Pseudomonas hygromyciniae]|uniref:Uncharacterized protein n=1 Tax=Pseudomonas hygromyciniae TaxID=2812000 RepID=A0ABX7K729_9PSED|nr:hypothetical protein [Pseudomonas hygromyciniae]MBN0980221.1 hypothetical protein [Pseudomonas hygromyciniae]QSB42438.1 hypothetical protein JTY93_10550 [Pseudomonas hygromyciniae]